ncbi:MAG: DUF4169 family protein [Hyphomicrobiales bacterium]
MDGTVVNLRLARKRRARSAKEVAAAQNRLAFGETKAARRQRRLLAEQTVRSLDAHKLDVPATATADGPRAFSGEACSREGGDVSGSPPKMQQNQNHSRD